MRLVALLIAFVLASPVLAKEAAPNADNPEIEARITKLGEDLRCLVCQNESLAGSRADLAQDLRREMREQMLAGKTDAEVIDYLTDRYGDFVLYRPPFKPVTYLLWLGPVLFLGIGGAVWYATLKRRRALQDQVQPDSEALKKATALLEQDPK